MVTACTIKHSSLQKSKSHEIHRHNIWEDDYKVIRGISTVKDLQQREFLRQRSKKGGVFEVVGKIWSPSTQHNTTKPNKKFGRVFLHFNFFSRWMRKLWHFLGKCRLHFNGAKQMDVVKVCFLFLKQFGGFFFFFFNFWRCTVVTWWHVYSGPFDW